MRRLTFEQIPFEQMLSDFYRVMALCKFGHFKLFSKISKKKTVRARGLKLGLTADRG